MEFVLTGFRQEINVRQYTFEAVAEDRRRTRVTVGADLALIRKYKIPLQELPLLCRRLLEGNGVAAKSSSLMFTEKEMLGYAKDRAAAEEAAALKRRAHRVPVSRRAAGWRSR
jgi:hypothetical protein